MLISKVKPSEAYTLFGKTRKKLFKVGLVIKDTTFSWDSKTNLFLWGGKKSYMNRLSYSTWGEPAGALSAGACWPRTAPCEPWWIKSSEKTRDSRPSLWMQPRREWAGGAEEQAFYLPRSHVIGQQPSYRIRKCLHQVVPKARETGGNSMHRLTQWIKVHATYTASSYLIFLRVFSGRTPNFYLISTSKKNLFEKVLWKDTVQYCFPNTS